MKPSRPQAIPGDQIALAVILDHEPGWHVHTNKPIPPAGVDPQSLFATTIKITGPAGMVQWPAQWPQAHELKLDIFGTGKAEPYLVYEGRAIAYVPVQLPPNLAPGSVASFKAEVHYQSCNDRTCLFDRTDEVEASVQMVSTPQCSPAYAIASATSAADAPAAKARGLTGCAGARSCRRRSSRAP